MNNQDTILFKNALLEAMANKYENQLAQCKEDDICSNAHLAKLEKILHIRTLPRSPLSRHKKILFAGILVAALLFSTLTVFAHRGEIRGFVEKIYEHFTQISFEDNQKHTIIECYTLSYVPEGFSPDGKSVTDTMAIYRWKNSEGAIITFTQTLAGNSFLGVNNEDGQSEIIEHSGLQIYASTFEYGGTYVWSDDNYAFKLSTTAPITNEELKLIIDGVSTKD